MVSAQQRFVILSLSKDLGTAAKENKQRLFDRSAKILRLRTSCSAQNDKFGQLLTPNSSFLIPNAPRHFPRLFRLFRGIVGQSPKIAFLPLTPLFCLVKMSKIKPAGRM